MKTKITIIADVNRGIFESSESDWQRLEFFTPGLTEIKVISEGKQYILPMADITNYMIHSQKFVRIPNELNYSFK